MGCVVSCEEYNCYGGLGDVIVQVLVVNYFVLQEFVVVNDIFGESGKFVELLDKYGLSVVDVVKVVKKVISWKQFCDCGNVN